MTDISRTLTATEIEGMMLGGYEQGAYICVGGGRLVCLDGDLWEVRNGEMESLGVVNPTAAVSSQQVREEVQRLLSKRHTSATSDYESAASPD